VLDLFDADQYAAFHGEAPPPGWRPATPQDIHAAAGGERPHIVFLSAPCKGFSGLLSETLSLTDKYQALNRLTLRGMWLTLEAFQDDPPELIIFENVPRIARRGRALLDRIGALLRHYGYAVAETTHDCGELGGLAQTR
jgi:site-specific DNA-cytosine methylase